MIINKCLNCGAVNEHWTFSCVIDVSPYFRQGTFFNAKEICISCKIVNNKHTNSNNKSSFRIKLGEDIYLFTGVKCFLKNRLNYQENPKMALNGFIPYLKALKIHNFK